MDFELNEQQLLMRDSAKEFAEKRLSPFAREWDEAEEMPKELLSEMAELGYFGMLLPEEYGGLGLDPLSYILALEEVSKANAAVEITLSVHNSLACQAIVQYGTAEQKKKYLPQMAKGELLGAYSLSEPDAGTDAGGLKTTAVKKGDSYIVNGTKNWVTNAGYAGIFVVFAKTRPELGREGISALLVEQNTKGFAVGQKEKKMGLKCSDTREIFFSDAEVPAGNLLGPEGQGLKMAFALLNVGRVAVGAQALGIAEAAFEEALKYSRQRVAFGVPIANFQATQFKLADMSTKIEAARLLVYKAALLCEKGGDSAGEVSMAKVFASEMANWVTNEAVQIHGGYGYVKEYAVERYFRDARVTEIYEGTSEAQKILISRSLLKKG